MFLPPPKGKKHVTCQNCRHHHYALSANMEQEWCQLTLPSDSVGRLTLRSRLLGRLWTVAGLAIGRLIFQANVSVKIWSGPLLASIHDKALRLHFRRNS